VEDEKVVERDAAFRLFCHAEPSSKSLYKESLRSFLHTRALRRQRLQLDLDFSQFEVRPDAVEDQRRRKRQT